MNDEEEDYYDEDEEEEDIQGDHHQLTHKLKGPIQRESILMDANRTFGSNSDLDKTMSALGGTFRLGGNSTFKASLKPNEGSRILPSIRTKDDKFMTKTKQLSLMTKESSKTTLNIMNVTFNSRPGVKQYINTVARQGPEASQLPKQGQR